MSIMHHLLKQFNRSHELKLLKQQEKTESKPRADSKWFLEVRFSQELFFFFRAHGHSPDCACQPQQIHFINSVLSIGYTDSNKF